MQTSEAQIALTSAPTADAPPPPGQTVRRGASDNLRGAGFMLLSALTFTTMTALVKYLGDDYSTPLQAFYRQAAGLLVMAPLIIRRGPAIFATPRPGMMMLRSIGAVAAINLSFYAYQVMPLADANALSFTRTLWIAPLAALLLRERLGLVRLGSILVGFAGVLIMTGRISVTSEWTGPVAALVASFVLALTLTGMKFLSRDHGATTLLAWAAVLGFVFSAPGAFVGWRLPDARGALLLATMGGLGMAAQYFYFRGMQLGDALAMTPIDYTRLAIAVALGWILFGDIPSVTTLAGAAIVIGSTAALIVYEGGRRARFDRPPSQA